ncbi:MAG: chalcone isomerase family protein [Alphaproteobacteria bacterium]
MKNSCKVLFFILALPLFSWADDCSNSVIKQYFGDQSKMGQGTVYKFVIPAYDISLWSKETPWSFNTLFALQVKCRWDASQKEMVDSTIEVMERQPTLTAEKSKEYRDLLNSFYPDLKEGDLVTVIVTPGLSIRFYHNDKMLKDIPDMDFAKHFCNIWLDKDTKYTSARKGLLGSNS